MSMREDAAALKLTELTVICGRLVAGTPNGALYEWHKDRCQWERLRKTSLVKRTDTERSLAASRAQIGRNARMTAEQRSSSASNAARARWGQ